MIKRLSRRVRRWWAGPPQLCQHCSRDRAAAAEIVCLCEFGVEAREEAYPHLVREL